MVKLNHKIKASGLLETLIAIVLIVVSFGVASMILINLLQSDNGRVKLHAAIELESMMSETLKTSDFIDETEERNHLKMIKTIEAYKGSASLYQLTITAKNEKDETLGQIKRLIIIDKQHD